MTPATTHRASHRLAIDAPEDLIFSILRESSHWPYLDGLTVYSERIRGDESNHELRISVLFNGFLSSSHCHRAFDAEQYRVEFHHSDLESPLVRLGGAWSISRAQGVSVVTLDHEYELEEVSAGLTEAMYHQIDDYSRQELDALKRCSERHLRLMPQRFSNIADGGLHRHERERRNRRESHYFGARSSKEPRDPR